MVFKPDFVRFFRYVLTQGENQGVCVTNCTRVSLGKENDVASLTYSTDPMVFKALFGKFGKERSHTGH